MANTVESAYVAGVTSTFFNTSRDYECTSNYNKNWDYYDDQYTTNTKEFSLSQFLCWCISLRILRKLSFNITGPDFIREMVVLGQTSQKASCRLRPTFEQLPIESLSQNPKLFPLLDQVCNPFFVTIFDQQTRSPWCRLLSESHFHLFRLLKVGRYTFQNLSQMRFE